MKKKPKTIKGYKAYDKGMECKGHKFKVGETYEEEKASCCQSGFHMCENPLDVLNYYDLCNSEFSKVEAIGDIDKNDDDSKLSTTKIKIGTKLSLKSFVECSVDFLLDICKKKKDSGRSAQLASSGDCAQLASSGHSAQLASSGCSAKLASSGHSAQLASSGDYAKLASSGDYAKLASSGRSAQLASSGDYAQLASSGDCAKLASSGDCAQLASSGRSAQLASSGHSAQLEVNGEKSVGANIGINGIIKGKKGSWITLAEYKNGDPVCVKSVKIDGKKIKEDTWYKLKRGKFTVVK
ncbi:MAG: hypothetical protein GY861_14495 [bacterium]|nr:hypothetical protein [bacterium]